MINFMSHYFFPQLMADHEFSSIWLPYFKEKHFPTRRDEIIFRVIKACRANNSKPIDKDMMWIALHEINGLSEREFDEAKLFLGNELPAKAKDVDKNWMHQETLKFYRNRIHYEAIRKSIAAHEEDKPEKVMEALRELEDVATFDPLKKNLVLSLDEFLESKPRSYYLIDRLFKKGFLYSITGSTGAGKTCITLRLSWHVAKGLPLGDREVKPGRVVYFAGENPDDVADRLRVMVETEGKANIQVFAQTSRGSTEMAIRELVKAGKDIALVVVDTSAAYFDGKDENDNKQALEHAKWLRGLSTRLPGNPTILACCHPNKGAEKDGLFPRGGSAFLNEVDGNLYCIKLGDFSILERCKMKYRDVDFPPLYFKRVVRYYQDGSKLASVIAEYSSKEDVEVELDENKEAETDILKHLSSNDYTDVREIAKALSWVTAKGNENKDKVSRAIRSLKKKGLLTDDKKPTLTEAGKSLLESVSCA